jgi:hypothetical protein
MSHERRNILLDCIWVVFGVEEELPERTQLDSEQLRRLKQVKSDNMPAYLSNMPAYSDNMPAYLSNMPAYSDNMPAYYKNMLAYSKIWMVQTICQHIECCEEIYCSWLIVTNIFQVQDMYPNGKFLSTGGAVPQLFTSNATKDELLNYILTGSTSNETDKTEEESDDEQNTLPLPEDQESEEIEANFHCYNMKVNNSLFRSLLSQYSYSS